MKGKKLKKLITSLSPHHVLKRLTGARVYNDVARLYGLVYFGNVSTRDEEYEMVRGLTVSAAHQDRHYCVGTVQGYDVILLERTDNLTFPGKPIETQRWIILQVDLRATTHLPHVFLDNRQHSSTFYDTLFAKFGRFNAADVNLFADHDPRFSGNFSVYITPDNQLGMIQLLTHDMTATLGHHFTQFDFEIFDDRLLVYSANRPPSKQLINHMLRVGIWFAREIEQKP
jgi:hypothetical protein